MLIDIWGLTSNLKLTMLNTFLMRKFYFSIIKFVKENIPIQQMKLLTTRILTSNQSFQQVKCMGESNCDARSQIFQQLNMIKHIFHSLKLKNI